MKKTNSRKKLREIQHKKKEKEKEKSCKSANFLSKSPMLMFEQIVIFTTLDYLGEIRGHQSS